MVLIIMITTILIKTFVQDLEDFYTAHCGDITGYISALHVANFLGLAVGGDAHSCHRHLRRPPPMEQSSIWGLGDVVISSSLCSPSHIT